MLQRLTAVTVGLMMMGFAVPANAQAPATLTLRSGEQISGQLVDLGSVGFTILVGGQERRIPQADVALVDFGGTVPITQADLDKMTGGQGLIVLKNGDTITGELYDIGGTQPLRITVTTGTGRRDLTSNDIGRIYLAKQTGQVAPATGETPSIVNGNSIQLSARQQWTDTGRFVTKGATLHFQSSGQITLDQTGNVVAGVAGATDGRYDAQAPLPRSFMGALIGRIGNGKPFGIGNQATIVAPATGQLFLGINDSYVGDNGGAFQITLDVTGGLRR